MPKLARYYSWIALLAYVCCAGFLLRMVLGHDTPGLIYDWSQPLLTLSRAYNNFFSIWSAEQNGSITLYKTGAYFDLIQWLASYTGISATFFFKGVLLGAFTLSGQSIYLWFKKEGFGAAASFVAGLFYLSSPLLLIRFSAGYVGYLVSAAFFPLVLMHYRQAAGGAKGWTAHAAQAGLYSLFGFFQSQFIAFYLLVVCLDAGLKFLKKKGGYASLRAGAAIFVAYILANLFWLIPAFSRASQVVEGGSFTDIAFVSRIELLPHSMWKAILLVDHAVAASAVDGFYGGAFRAVLLLAVALVAVLAYKNKEKRQLFLIFFIATLVLLPVSLGASSPFGRIFPFLFTHLPGMQLFRESYHTHYVFLLFYTVMVAAAAQFASKRFGTRSMVLGAALIGIGVFNAFSFTGSLGGFIGSVDLPSGSAEADAKLSDLTAGRLYYPPGLSYWRLDDERRIGSANVDHLALSFERPSVGQASSDLETRNLSDGLRNATAEAFMEKDPNFVQRLSFLGSDTLVSRPFLHSRFYEYAGLQYLSERIRQTWIKEPAESKFGAFPSLEKVTLNQNYIAYRLPKAIRKPILYAASSLSSICSYGDITPETRSFAYHVPGSLEAFASEGCTDKQAAQVRDAKTRIPLGSIANLKHSASLGWSAGSLSFYESQAVADAIEESVITRVPDDFTVAVPRLAEGETLLVKYYASPEGGRLKIGDVLLDTVSEKPVWKYQVLADIGSLNVQAESGVNGIGGLVVTDGRSRQQEDVQKLSSVPIAYTHPNLTEYAAEIVQTSEPKLVIVSENYDSRWVATIGGRTIKPVLVNGYANGFLVPGDLSGTLEISYQPQGRYAAMARLSLLFVGLLLAYALTFRFLKKA